MMIERWFDVNKEIVRALSFRFPDVKAAVVHYSAPRELVVVVVASGFAPLSEVERQVLVEFELQGRSTLRNEPSNLTLLIRPFTPEEFSDWITQGLQLPEIA